MENPDSPVFVLESGKLLKRHQVASATQQVLMSVGVPKHMAGSHSWRRAGGTLYHSAGMPDEDVKRMGKWNSSAYKLYIHCGDELTKKWTKAFANKKIRFELN